MSPQAQQRDHHPIHTRNQDHCQQQLHLHPGPQRSTKAWQRSPNLP